jgi:hypothetical protein
MPPPPTQIAGTSFGDHTWSSMIIAQLNPNGTLTTHFFNMDIWDTNQPPSLSSMNTNKWTSIAINNNMRFYGITDGGVYEFTIEKSLPKSWTYNGQVRTPDSARK